MSQVIELADVERWLLAYADRISQQEPYLTELDAAIGDADHGTNMNRGMSKVRQRLATGDSADKDVSALLRNVAMTLISTVGGAAGPLYGAFFLSASRDVNKQMSVTPAELAKMFRSGLKGVQQRGKAALDEKTMVDVLSPAVNALENAVAAGESVETALTSACQAAEGGMLHTVGLQASKGRASYLGPRSVGHQDPGATSAYYLFETAVKTLGHRQS